MNSALDGAVDDELDSQGAAIVPALLSVESCRELAACYDDADAFRSRIVMQRHGFGRGEYQYFRYPLPPLVAELRERLYGPLARIAKWFLVHVLGQVERDLPRYQLASRMAAPFGRDLLDTGLKLERAGDRAPFDIPDHLARTWDILA